MLCRRKQHGFSLIELITAMAIVVVMATVAVPSFSLLQETARQQSTAENIRNYLALARIEAITRQQWVTICHSYDQAVCVGDALNGTSQWSGILMFVDPNRQRVPDHPSDILRVGHFRNQVNVHWNRGDSLTYQPDGSVTGFSNGTFRVTAGNPAREHRLILSLSGRVREEIP